MGYYFMLDINNKIKTWRDHKKQDALKGIVGISKFNSDIIKKFLSDYELGLNIGMFKGRRSPSTLTKLRHQLIFFAKNFNKNLNKISKKDLHKLFKDMEEGIILKPSGKKYIGVGEFVKSSKSFFGWLKRTDQIKENPTIDLSISASNGTGRKPAWVYLDNKNIKRLINNARGDYRALILFIYDSGIRPQEAWRLKIGDFREDYTELNIPEVRDNGDRVSKTFERTIKLTQSANLIKNYIEVNNLKDDDMLINITQNAFNQYLRRTCKKLFEDKPTKARGSPHQFKCYDLRHNSCIYYLDKYKRNSDLMYRFGWKKEDKIFYYSEFLGKRDRIDEDMITQEDKDKYQKQIDELKTKIQEFAPMFKFMNLTPSQQKKINDSLKGTPEKSIIQAFENSVV